MTKVEQRKHRSILAKKENNEYEDLAEQVKVDIAKSARVFIPELAEKLTKKYLPDDELTDEEYRERNKQIERRILQDWGNGKPWATGTVQNVFPDWVKLPYRIRAGKAGRQQQMFTKSEQNRKEQAKQLEKAFKSIQKPTVEEIQEIKEEVRGEKITPDSGWKSTVTFGARETVEDELDTPEQLHDDAMRAYARLWQSLGNRDNLPSDSTDVFVDNIKSSRNFRSRMLKGLPADIRAGFINQTTWVHMLLTDLLKMDQELTKEEKHYGR